MNVRAVAVFAAAFTLVPSAVLATGPQPAPLPEQPVVQPAAQAGAQSADTPREPPVHLVGTFGVDFGSTKLVEAVMSDGSSRSLKANQGVNGSVGAAFLKLAGDRIVTQATIGLEYSAISASNGSVRWLAFPVEVMEFAYVNPVRFGLGLSYLLGASVKGDGFFDGLEADFKSSPGLVMQADWAWRLPRNARSARLTLGVRYTIQQLESKETGASIDANAFGIVAGFTG